MKVRGHSGHDEMQVVRRDGLTDALERRAVLRIDLLVIGEIMNHLDPG
jgi:hypothetical protein